MQRTIATFHLGEVRLGLDILVVKEVHRQIILTKVPSAPEMIRGLMNLRGKVMTVIDLDVLLERPSRDSHEDSRLLILKTDSEITAYLFEGILGDLKLGDDIVGLLIDGMSEVLEVDDEEILPTPANMDEIQREYTQGVIKLEDGLVILLNVEALLERILTCEWNAKAEQA